MKKRQFIRGTTPHQKFESINKTLNQFWPRLHHSVVAAIPPIPIFEYADAPDDEGVILRKIFPGKGVITKGCLYIEEYVKEGPVNIRVQVEGAGGGNHAMFETKDKLVVVEPNLPVDAGSRLTLSVLEPENINGIWIAFMYEVGMQGAGKEMFVLDQLMEMAGEPPIDDGESE